MAKLTDKQKRFIEEYLVDFNATQAAIRSGYSENTANEIGSQNLAKVSIKTEINARLDVLGMEAGEITKRITNLARGNMSDYLVKRHVPYTPEIKISLQEYINRLQDQIDFEDEYALQVNMEDDELKEHMSSQESRRRKKIRCKLELEKNPYAFRIVAGETRMVEEASLDLVKIMQDKERGIIKSFKHTKDGVQVELYPADAALAQMAKIRGMLVDKSEVDNKVTMMKPLIIDWGETD